MMDEINRKVEEIVRAEESAVRAKDEAIVRRKNILKNAESEKEGILAAADKEIQQERERIIMEKKAAAETEVKKIIIDSEIQAAKISSMIEGKNRENFEIIEKELRLMTENENLK